MVQRCPNSDCGSTERYTDHAAGNVYCAACGWVLEDSIIVSEVSFGETSSGAAIAQGTLVHHGQTTARFNGKHGNHVANTEGSRQAGEQRLSRLQADLGFSHEIREKAGRLYQLCLDNSFTKGRKVDQVAAACAYIMCRQKATQHMLIDFSDALRINVFELGAVYSQLVRKIPTGGVPVIDPSQYVERFAQLLEFGDDTRKVAGDAMKLLKHFSRDWLNEGRRPSGVCGAAVLLAARMNNYRRSVHEIVQVAKIADSTIEKRLNEFAMTETAQLTLAQLTEQPEAESLPTDMEDKQAFLDAKWADAGVHGWTESQLPPAMRRNLQREAELAAKERFERGDGEDGEEEEEGADGEDQARPSKRQRTSQNPASQDPAQADIDNTDPTSDNSPLPHNSTSLNIPKDLLQYANADPNGNRLDSDDELPEDFDFDEESSAIYPISTRAGPSSSAPLSKDELKRRLKLYTNGDPLPAEEINKGMGELAEDQEAVELGNDVNALGQALAENVLMMRQEERKHGRKGKGSSRSRSRSATPGRKSASPASSRRTATSPSQSRASSLAPSRAGSLAPSRGSSVAPSDADSSNTDNHEESAKTPEPEDTLSDIDDDELEKYICNEAEVVAKERLWVEFNKDWLETLAAKGLDATVGKLPRKKRVKPSPRDASTPAGTTAGESARNMINSKSTFSKKINYAALGDTLTNTPDWEVGKKLKADTQRRSKVNAAVPAPVHNPEPLGQENFSSEYYDGQNLHENEGVDTYDDYGGDGDYGGYQEEV